jgi:hypothetical protein
MLLNKITLQKKPTTIRINPFLKIGFILCIALTIFCPLKSYSQNAFEKDLRKKMDSLISEKGQIVISQYMLPNNSVASIMTPSGWGSYGTFVFAVLGGIYPAGYTNKADLIGSAGITFGNPNKAVNVSASVNVARVSEFQDFSVNLVLSREVFKNSSISVGGLQLFADEKISDAAFHTYYIAFSHAVQTVKSKRPGFAALSYTIGFGTGRFLLKSPYDIENGKGKYGTGVFGSISYEIFKQVNLNAEWSGLNLGFSTGFRPIKNNNLTLGLGVYNLTRYSGDRPGVIATLGLPISLDRKSKYR